MKILLAADGSKFTEDAVAFLAAHRELLGEDELAVLHVQPPIPPGVKGMVGGAAVTKYHEEEAGAVLGPLRQLLELRGIPYRCDWAVGHTADEILRAVERQLPQMVVMGTHGRGFLGRALMGSVAQQVVAGCPVPVLLAK